MPYYDVYISNNTTVELFTNITLNSVYIYQNNYVIIG